MNQFDLLSRRNVLSRLGCGFGGLALGTLLRESSIVASAEPELSADFQPRAKAVIQLYNNLPELGD